MKAVLEATLRRLFFVTHPEVVVDPGRPVNRWFLSNRGVERMREFACSHEVQTVRSIWASDETKAIEAAGILAGSLGLSVNVKPELHENDRTATGFLPPAEFEKVADEFFAQPHQSIRGWERAIDAQTRIKTAFRSIVEAHGDGDIAIVAHGAVGTLLLCDLLKVEINRSQDQPFQGHFWTYSLDGQALLHRWRPIAAR